MGNFALPPFYAITDLKSYGKRDLPGLVNKMITGGVKLIQYRDKEASKAEYKENAKKLRTQTIQHNIILILNDHIEVVEEVGAEGIHLGQEDMNIISARKLLGPKKIIGISTHNLVQALEAEKKGADYIGCGPIYATNTKPDYAPVGLELLKSVSQIIKIPVVAIGGITIKKIPELKQAGAKSVAMLSAICGSTQISEDIKQVSAKLT